MAMSARERKQKQLEREREQAKLLDDSSYPYLRTPFFELEETDPNWSSFTLPLELAGFEPPSFGDDEGPWHHAREDALPPDGDPEDTFPGAKRSIGRAEVMVDMLLDAALELAQIVNSYKLDELSARKKELESADLSNPADREKAFAQIAQITRIEAELNKNVRRTLPQWKVKGA